MTIIYHNPRCSKSRATLSLLEENGIQPDVVRYLDTPPDVATLRQITEAMGCSIGDILRKGEARYKELDIDGEGYDEEALLKLVADNPILLERPIVVEGDRAAMGRPPENVLTLFNS